MFWLHCVSKRTSHSYNYLYPVESIFSEEKNFHFHCFLASVKVHLSKETRIMPIVKRVQEYQAFYFGHAIFKLESRKVALLDFFAGGREYCFV